MVEHPYHVPTARPGDYHPPLFVVGAFLFLKNIVNIVLVRDSCLEWNTLQRIVLRWNKVFSGIEKARLCVNRATGFVN